MSEPGDLRPCNVLLGNGGPLAGRIVLVSAGGTREPLDAVRYLGNRSSGRMGVALAEEARRRGADVSTLGREPRRATTTRCRGGRDIDRCGAGGRALARGSRTSS
jgi:hypothetical protein